MAKALIDEDLVNATTNQLSLDRFKVLYFFFKDVGEQSYATTALCALLHQLFSDHSTWQKCLEDLEKLVDIEGEALKTGFAALWRLLLESVSKLDLNTTVCILDALDECRTAERTVIIENLEKIASNRSCKTPIKFLVTSRPYQRILYDFKLMITQIPSIHLAGENESGNLNMEINLVIDHKVREIGWRMSLSPFIIDTLVQRLQEMQQRTYLWLAFMLEEIRNLVGPSDRELLQQISELPTTVEDAYERILQRSSRPQLAKVLLPLVTIANRPLLLEELELLAKVTPWCHDKKDIDLIGPDRFKDVARDACGLFLTVVDDRVFLIHQTAKEFLIKHNSISGQSGIWKGSVDVHAARLDMANKCMISLCLRRSWSSLNELAEYSYSEWETHRENLMVSRDTSIEYALSQWEVHLQSLDANDAGLVVDSFERLGQEVLDPDVRPVLFTAYMNKQKFGVTNDTPAERELRLEWAQNLFTQASYRSLQKHKHDESPAIMLASLICANGMVDHLLSRRTDTSIATGSYLETSFDLAVLCGNTYQVRSFLSKYPTQSLCLRLNAHKYLRYTLPTEGLTKPPPMLSLLVDAGLRIDEKSQGMKSLARILDIQLLFRAGLNPLAGYLLHLIEVRNLDVLERVAEDAVTWQQLAAAVSVVEIGKSSTHEKQYSYADFQKKMFEQIDDALIRALPGGANRKSWELASHLVAILRRVSPEVGKLCPWCYAFCFQRERASSEMTRLLRDPSSINYGTSGPDLLQCDGPGPQATVASDRYDRIIIEQNLWLDNARVHPNITMTLHWSAFLAVLHDKCEFLGRIISYLQTRSIQLSLDSDGQNLPSGIQTACYNRAKRKDLDSWGYSFGDQEDNIDSGQGSFGPSHANLLLRWTLEATLAIIEATDIGVLPRNIFDGDAIDRLALCITCGADRHLVVRFAEHIKTRMPLDRRYVVLDDHLKNLVDRLLRQI